MGDAGIHHTFQGNFLANGQLANVIRGARCYGQFCMPAESSLLFAGARTAKKETTNLRILVCNTAFDFDPVYIKNNLIYAVKDV